MTKTVVQQTYESEINNNLFRLWITVDVNFKFKTVYVLSVHIVSIQSISIVFHMVDECLQMIAAVVWLMKISQEIYEVQLTYLEKKYTLDSLL